MKECCGNCRRFIFSGKTNAMGEGLGWCDNWAGVEITTECICSPSVFIPKQDLEEKEGEK